MDFKKKKLQNGLTTVAVGLPSLESATITIWAKVGSRYEKKQNAGISHFLEHMVFKGSKKRPSSEEISKTLDSMGAEFNAATAREYTNFYIKVRKGVLDKAFDVLSDMVLNPLLKDEDIKRERMVVLEEISMKEDMPIEKVGHNFASLVFGKHPMGEDIAGTAKSVGSIKKEDFEEHRKKHYGAKNMAVTIAGGVDSKKSFELAEKFLGSLNKGKNTKPKAFKAEQKKAQVNLENKKTEQAHILLGFRGYEINHKDRYALSVLAAILGKGMSSRLFTEVRERRGLAYAVGTSVSRYSDTGIITTYAGVGTKKAEETIKVILDQHLGMASLVKNSMDEKYKVSDNEFNKAKEYIKGKMALSLEDTIAVNDFFGTGALFFDKIKTPEDVFEAIDEVKLGDVYRIASDLFVSERLNLAVIGPYNNKSKFEKLVKI